MDAFQQFWSRYKDKALGDRRAYFDSLPKSQRTALVKSFYHNGWRDLLIMNYADKMADYIKSKYAIDLVDMRIKAINGRVFLIERKIWDEIESLLNYFDNSPAQHILFGGLLISSWGKKRQFCKIRAK